MNLLEGAYSYLIISGVLIEINSIDVPMFAAYL